MLESSFTSLSLVFSFPTTVDALDSKTPYKSQLEGCSQLPKPLSLQVGPQSKGDLLNITQQVRSRAWAWDLGFLFPVLTTESCFRA